PVWLFGFGNEVPAPGDKNDFRSFRSQLDVQLGLGYQAWPHWSVRVGPELTLADAVQPGGAVLDTLDVYGAGKFDQLALGGSFELDTRDSDQYPRSGRRWRLTARVAPSLMDVEDTFGGLTADLRQYLSAEVAGDPALHLRLRVDRTWGRTPFFELPYLGGSGALPGFVRRRFVGDAAASATALARVKLFEPRLVTDLQLGLHAIGAVGRVWYDGDPSTRWHVGKGGGVWLRLPSIDRTVSVSFVTGDKGVRAYLDFGFLF
ncbi:MAG TPA: BamA/TamA family outer membrane protein, partial [Longimicrobiales bacterium]|nr:BamA/TamA family outer membrane protein [Longimicrobiales bacterium]